MSHAAETAPRRGSSSSAGRRTPDTRTPLTDRTAVSLRGVFGSRPAFKGTSHVPADKADLASRTPSRTRQVLGPLRVEESATSMEALLERLRAVVEERNKERHVREVDVPMDVNPDAPWLLETPKFFSDAESLRSTAFGVDGEDENAPLPRSPSSDSSSTSTPALCAADRLSRKRSRELPTSPERQAEKRRRSLPTNEVREPLQDFADVFARYFTGPSIPVLVHPDTASSVTSTTVDVTSLIEKLLDDCVAIPVYPTPGNVHDRLKIFRKKYAPPVVSSPLNPARDQLLSPEAIKVHYQSVFPRLESGQTSAYERAAFEPRSWVECFRRQCRSSHLNARSGRPCWKCEHTSAPLSLWRRNVSKRWAEQLASDESLEQLFREDPRTADDEADYSDAYLS